VYSSVTRAPDIHALGNWIQVVNYANVKEKDTDNAVPGVWFIGFSAVEGIHAVL
jgi:hypothetical protein